MAAVPQVARISLKNILFPTDFSIASQAALPFAVSLAHLYGAKLHFLHALSQETHRPPTQGRLASQDDCLWEQARNKLEWFANDIPVAEISHEALLASGDLGLVIPALIQQHKIDMIVVGTHGRTGLSRMLMGSAAEKIYRAASCPVLTVGPNVHSSDWKPKRILCPVDMAGIPKAAVSYASALASDHDGVLILMQAIPMVPWQHRADVEIEACARLENLVSDREAQCLIRWEHPGEAILRAAVDREADLIVMGVRKSRAGSWSSHLPWPVASEVVSGAACPVLTVRI